MSHGVVPFSLMFHTSSTLEYLSSSSSSSLTSTYTEDGNSISEAVPAGKEGITYADIHVSKTIESKNWIDPAGHYSSKALSATVNTRTFKVVNRTANDLSQFPIPYDVINGEGQAAN